MDSDVFSVAALTSSCASIAANAVSTTAELQALSSDGGSSDGLLTLAEGLMRIGDEVPPLEQALRGASVISVRLQSLLKRTLMLGDAAVARLHKQITRVSAENSHLLDQDYIARHCVLLVAFAEMAGLLTHVVSLSTKEEQDVVFEADEEQKLLHGQTALSDCAQITSILVDDPVTSTTASHHKEKSSSSHLDEPPAYIPPPEPPSAQAAQDTNSDGSSFSSIFKALASHFTSRPDPFASALNQAIANSDASQVSFLLSQGASVNGRDEQGQTPLSCAIAADDEAILTLLLAAGAKTTGSGNSTSWFGTGEMPPLFQAARDGKLRIARALVDRGADVREQSTMGQPWFYDVCGGTGTRQGVEFLLSNGADPRAESLAGRPVLIQAVRAGHVELAALLLEHGADARCCDVSGSPALVLAAENKLPTMVKLLLDNGADVDASPAFGGSLLSESLAKGRMDLLQLLLERGASADVSDAMGQPLLISALRNTKLTPEEKEDLVERLLKNGAKADTTDMAWGNTALYHALQLCSAKVVELLLCGGARPGDTLMPDSVPTLLYAMGAGKRAEARLLIAHGADVNATDPKGRLPLMQAVLQGDADTARLLVEKGAKVGGKGSVDVETVARALGKTAMLEALGL